MGRSFTKKWIF